MFDGAPVSSGSRRSTGKNPHFLQCSLQIRRLRVIWYLHRAHGHNDFSSKFIAVDAVAIFSLSKFIDVDVVAIFAIYVC